MFNIQATGSIRPSWQSIKNTLAEQAAVGALLGSGLALGGFVRVRLAYGPGGEGGGSCGAESSGQPWG